MKNPFRKNIAQVIVKDEDIAKAYDDALRKFEPHSVKAHDRADCEKLGHPVAETTQPDNDPVNHPSHYTDGKIEVIDFIEDKKLNFYRGNAVKYISRAGKKDNELEDLRKARWYLDREINKLESEDFMENQKKVKEALKNLGPLAV